MNKDTFGENEAYTTSDFLAGFRHWLQRTFQLGIPIFWGRFPFIFLPHKVKLHLEIGKPIQVTKISKDAITQQDIDKLHELFINEVKRLFNRTKSIHGLSNDIELNIY